MPALRVQIPQVLRQQDSGDIYVPVIIVTVAVQVLLQTLFLFALHVVRPPHGDANGRGSDEASGTDELTFRDERSGAEANRLYGKISARDDDDLSLDSQ